MAGSAGKQFFGRNASVLLDILRFAAALAVALSHMPLHFVAAGPIVSERAGNTAVCVFFVLSGFVIRYVTVARVTDGRSYFIDRASRIYSVVAPMLLLTILLVVAASVISPMVYRQMEIPFHWGEIPGEVFHNLTFTVGWWDWGEPPLSNAPFWSLSYECVYYALYGLWRYAPRARWWSVPLLLLAVGPAMALLFPIWLLGVALHDVYVWLHGRPRGVVWAAGSLCAYCAVLWLFRRPIGRFLLATTVTSRTAMLNRFVQSFAWGRNWFGGQTVHWMDRFSVSYFLTGTLMAAGLLPLLLSLDRYLPPVPRGAAAKLRVVADSTFPLYLLHWPYFLFVVCVHGGPIPDWRGGLAMLLGAIVISIGLAMLFDRWKNALRGTLRRFGSDRRAPGQS